MFDPFQSERRFVVQYLFERIHRLILRHDLVSDLDELGVLGFARLVARLQGRRLALELGAFGILGAGDGGGLGVGALPFFQRVIA